MSGLTWFVLAFVALSWMAVPTDTGFASETELMAMSDGTPPPPPQ